jgi:hypothetical protein
VGGKSYRRPVATGEIELECGDAVVGGKKGVYSSYIDTRPPTAPKIFLDDRWSKGVLEIAVQRRRVARGPRAFERNTAKEVMKNRSLFSSPLGLFLLFLLTVILAPSAMALDEEDHDQGPTERCHEAVIEGIAPSPYLNGLPLVLEELEIVGDATKVIVQIPPFCSEMTPASLPFRWDVTGPSGPVSLTGEETLRPHFRPTAAGQYEAQITYCPETDPCHNVRVGSTTTVDIPPQTARFDFTIVDEIPLPPDTKSELTAEAQTEGFTQWVDVDHEMRAKKCGGLGFSIPPVIGWNELETPQLVVIGSWSDQYPEYQFLEGEVKASRIAGYDNTLNHNSHDVGIDVTPDTLYAKLKVPEKDTIEVEWESDYYRPEKRPLPGDRISAWGFHTYDCHHNDDVFGVLAEIHPPVLTAVHRRRPIRIPDGWQDLGTNIYVPGIITDIYANKLAGAMTSDCAETGLHQHSPTTPPGTHQYGPCIQSPHPLNAPGNQQFSFHIYLPPNPQKRMAAAGMNVPPAPLYCNIESGGEHLIVGCPMPGGVAMIDVFVDLRGYNDQEFVGRIVAGWVQPSPDNWGLERWKVGIESIYILDDHDPDPYNDGDCVLWAAINNRDQEWTRLLDGDAVTGLHTFNPPFQTTDLPLTNRSLGPHLLLFHPHIVDFPGLPLEDLNRSFLIHTSGYDADPVWDDPAGAVNRILNLGALLMPVGSRWNVSSPSDAGDYFLNYFVERLGPVLPNLTATGQALVSTYSLHPHEARCTGVSRSGACVLFPERIDVVKPWHPLLARLHPKGPELNWRDFPAYKPQEPEELGFTGMSFPEFRASLARGRNADPKRVERFLVQLRQKFDQKFEKARGTRMEAEFAKALRKLKANLPADLWQLHFGDIDPTAVASSRLRLWAAIGAIIALMAGLAFWFFRRKTADH